MEVVKHRLKPGHRLKRKQARTDLQSFELFASLPREVQIMIWEIVLRSGRKIQLKYNDKTSRWSSLCPPLLHVNYQSRVVALKHFERRFGGRVYVNFCSDVVFFSHRTWSSIEVGAFNDPESIQDVKKIKRLSLVYHSNRDLNVLHPGWFMLRYCAKLDLLKFYLRDPSCTACPVVTSTTVCDTAKVPRDTYCKLMAKARCLKRFVNQIRRKITSKAKFVKGDVKVKVMVSKTMISCHPDMSEDEK
ncbi:hypothetical protein PVAG01_08600 [Phlyctema vagabunda]|uniref:2EXR domain-containing protein n=1 Tax=Phlyctema vagabunda TaxID=108571 RepID=A0ABR4P9V8_9HELO